MSQTSLSEVVVISSSDVKLDKSIFDKQLVKYKNMNIETAKYF